MKFKRRKKPLRGARKIHLLDLPWMTIIKFTAIIIVCGTLIYQFFALDFHTKRSSATQIENQSLNSQVSSLIKDLSNEKASGEATLAKQLKRIAGLDTRIGQLEESLNATNGENVELLTQLESVRLQNTILRNKLGTLLGTSSRSGEELSPSPMGVSGLTLGELQVLTANTKLAGIEQALLQIEVQYNVNALYALAVAKLETGSGTSFLVNDHNNLFGMRGSNGWFNYSSTSESVLAFGWLMANNYFPKGYDTLEKIGPRYAEGSNTWAPKAKYHMLNDMRKLHK